MIPRPDDHDLTDHSVYGRSMADIVNRCFLTAYLLIGDLARAENAVMEAIDHWNPDEDDERQLVELSLKTAVRAQITTSPLQSNREKSSDFPLPTELRRVLGLPPGLRYCLVLRMLAGLPSRVCADMLDSDVSHIDQRCCDAVEHLASLTYAADGREETCRINTRFL